MIPWTWNMCRAGQRAGSCLAGGQPRQGLLRGKLGRRGLGSSHPAMRRLVSLCASMLANHVPSSNSGKRSFWEVLKIRRALAASLYHSLIHEVSATFYTCSSAVLENGECQKLCDRHIPTEFVGNGYQFARLPTCEGHGYLSRPCGLRQSCHQAECVSDAMCVLQSTPCAPARGQGHGPGQSQPLQLPAAKPLCLHQEELIRYQAC